MTEGPGIIALKDIHVIFSMTISHFIVGVFVLFLYILSYVLVLLQPSYHVDGDDMEKSDDKHDTKEMERNDTNDLEKNDVPAGPGVDLGLVLQLRGSEEDRQGLLSDLDNMEIAWEDFILEEPGTTRALVQANLTTR